MEELTTTVLESGLMSERATARAGRPAVVAGDPATLQNSLMARLDRLAPLKEVAQVAAVIGREFPHDLLADVAAPGGDALREALGRSRRRG